MLILLHSDEESKLIVFLRLTQSMYFRRERAFVLYYKGLPNSDGESRCVLYCKGLPNNDGESLCVLYYKGLLNNDGESRCVLYLPLLCFLATKAYFHRKMSLSSTPLRLDRIFVSKTIHVNL